MSNRNDLSTPPPALAEASLISNSLERPAREHDVRSAHRTSTTRDRLRYIAALALPIVGGMVSQNLLNLVDTAMVGSLGTVALAAVGIGSFAQFVSGAFLMGASAGVQAMAARRFGEGKHSETALPLNAALLLAVGTGVPLAALVIALAPSFFPLLNPNPAVSSEAIPYFTARASALAFVGLNFSFRGYFNGTNRSGVYMKTLMVIHATNIFLNWLLIFGALGAPQLGTLGAGIASAISTVIGSGVYVLLAKKHATSGGFLRAWPSWQTIRGVFRLSSPNGVQHFLFAAGHLTMMWVYGRIGTQETAAAQVLINIMLVSILPSIALGMAATSLVSQSLGRNDSRDAKRWGWEVTAMASVVAVIIALPALLLTEPILGIFIHESQTLEVAVWPLRIFALTSIVDVAGPVLQNALLGAGANRLVMTVSIGAQWFVAIPLAILVGLELGYGLIGIWLVHGLHRLLLAGIFTGLWAQGKWAQIRI